MKKRHIVLISTLIVAILQPTKSQTVVHPWHVVDNGGGKSSAGSVFLHASIGQPAIQAMSVSGTSLEGGYIPGIRFLGGTTSILDVTCETGWNLVSLPFIVGDPRKSILYPAGTSAAFAYLGSYQPKDTLKNGVGYWIKFPSPASVHFTGTTIQKETVQVFNNWNIVGAMSYPSLVSGVTPLDTTVLVSNFFGYKSAGGYYAEDTLKAGLGYWIKVRYPGKIVITTGSVVMDPALALRSAKETENDAVGHGTHQQAGKLTIRDAGGRERELYLSTNLPLAELTKWEMPPTAFEGMMDVRFATNRMLESDEAGKSKEVAVDVTSAKYPITLFWKMDAELKGTKLLIDGKEIAISGSGETRIAKPESRIVLSLAPSSERELPKTFALYQNYPNPFNPTTTIRYDLPNESQVRIVIYDALGQQVDELVAGIQQAGFQSIVWKGENARRNTVASGMYFYRIEATTLSGPPKTFTEVRKMILIK